MFGLFSRKRKFGDTYQTKLTDSDAANYDELGASIALSDDGNTLLVGVPYDDVGANANQGSVVVFTRTNNVWSQQTKLTETGGSASDQFGLNVAVSSDGNTALIGVSYDAISGQTNQGSAIVFTRSGSTWTQQAKLTDSSGAAYHYFGYGVDLSSDGNTALVGAPYDTNGVGRALVFTRSGTTWTKQATLTDSSGANGDNFGYNVALSGDGNTALIGSINDTVTVNYQGSGVVFVRSGSSWSQQARLTASSPISGAYFSYSLKLSYNGDTALIGAINDKVGTIAQGSAYIFTRSGTSWTQQAKLVDSSGANGDQFGTSVALSNSGNIALVGAIADMINGSGDQGSASVFIRSGTTWTQQIKLTDSSGAINDRFGSSVSLSGNGNIAAIGAQGDTTAWTYQGSAFIWNRR